MVYGEPHSHRSLGVHAYRLRAGSTANHQVLIGFKLIRVLVIDRCQG